MKTFLKKLLKVAVLFVLMLLFFLLLCVRSAAGAAEEPVDKPIEEQVIRALVIAAEGNEMPVVANNATVGESVGVSGAVHIAGIDTNALLALDKQDLQDQVPVLTSLGTYKITAYCACQKCCGKSPDDPRYGITATGTRATQGRTIAADPKVLPYGTVVVINGHEYVVEDCGGAIDGKEIDMYFDSHQEAREWGNQYWEVFTYD